MKPKFNKTNVYKKGILAEKIVKKFLNQKGYVVYEPFQEKKDSKWEFFDMMCIERNNSVKKPKTFLADVKAKSRLNLYNATGIDLRHFKKYIKISETLGIPFKLFFVDEYNRKVSYINLTREMVLPENKIVDSGDGRTYPLVKDFNKGKDKMILFSVEQLTHLTIISEEEQKKLKALNERGEYDIIDFYKKK